MRIPSASKIIFFVLSLDELLKEALSLMPLEKVGSDVFWDSFQELLPLAPSLKELSINAERKESEEIDEEASCLKLNQQVADLLIAHTRLLENLTLKCPLHGHVNFSSLSHLKELEIRYRDSEIPDSDRPAQLCLTLPNTVENLVFYSDFSIDLSKLGPTLRPLHALRAIDLFAPAFTALQLKDFFNYLPSSIEKIDMAQFLQRPTAGTDVVTTVSIRLPRLRELNLGDKLLPDVPIQFEFAVAPRLVVLLMRARSDQVVHILKSLLRFPQASNRTYNS